MAQLSIYLYIALGGAMGACLRYWLSELCASLFGRGFPYGTLTVNVLGSLFMGILMAAIHNGSLEASPWRYLIGLGLLGALTTFSTFSMDNLLLIQQGEILKLVMNILLNVTLSLVCVWLGFQILIKN